MAPKSSWIYLSGPVRGKVASYHAFRLADKLFRDKGWEVCNPTNAYGGRTDLPIAAYMVYGLTKLLACDAIALLPGWESSRGSMLELLVARACGMRTYDATTGEAFTVVWPGVYHAAPEGYWDDGWESLTRQQAQDFPPDPQASIKPLTQDSAPRATPSAAEEAQQLVNGERRSHYGKPSQSWSRIAALWSAFLEKPLTASDAVLMMELMKVARLKHKPRRNDLVDAHGYLICYEEIEEVQ